MKQIVAYRLTEGTVPTFISDGGYYMNNDLFVGVTVDGLPLPENVSIFNTKEELTTYFNTFFGNLEADILHPDIPVLTAEEAADAIWSKLNA
jgi:hypothetical protein